MKKALLAVGFGTTHRDAEERCILPVEDALRTAFPDRKVFRAWTSRLVREALARRGERVGSVGEELARLRAEGYGDIGIVSTHIIPGGEYEKVLKEAAGLPVSRPLLDTGEDLFWTARFLEGIAREEKRPLLMMGHGSACPADGMYGLLAEFLPENVFLACVEGAHGLDGVLPALERLRPREVTLMPLMLVAGDHAKNDLAGEKDSWKTRLESMGFGVRVRMQGLGELPAVQARFVRKARAMLRNGVDPLAG